MHFGTPAAVVFYMHPTTHTYTHTYTHTHPHTHTHTHTHTHRGVLALLKDWHSTKKAIFNTRSQDWHIPASVPWPILLSGRHIWCVLPSLKLAHVSHTLWIGPLSSPLSARLWHRTMTTRCIPRGRTLFYTGSIKKTCHPEIEIMRYLSQDDSVSLRQEDN